jgi:hypothetical protein
MALYWLREYDSTLGPIIREQGDLLNVVLDNIKRQNHAEARLAWILHCEEHVAKVSRSYDPDDAFTAIRWNCEGIICDCTWPITMFKMQVNDVFEPCSQGDDTCIHQPYYVSRLNDAPVVLCSINTSYKDMHQIQQERIDKFFHSGVDVQCGRDNIACINIDTECDEVVIRTCKGVRKKSVTSNHFHRL